MRGPALSTCALVLQFGVFLTAVFAAQPAFSMSGGDIVAPANACEAIAREDFAGLLGAPTAISKAEAVAATENKPSHCRITGVIAPQIQFELRLPDQWNGRYLQGGCGGFCGFNMIEACADGQARGFAIAASNLGHVGDVWSPPVWATDPQLRQDFGGRATHVLAVASKAIIAKFYGAPVRYSYFKGCSTGGREGLKEAQHHPEDFDGIIAGDPAFAGRLGAVWNNWIGHKLMTSAGAPVFEASDLTFLHEKVLQACDGIDGLEDGIIVEPRKCHFKPAELLCKEGSRNGCLSHAQVAAAEALYDGARNSSGILLYPGSAEYGSELDWNGPVMAHIAEQSLRFLSFPEARPTYQYRNFDWDRDIEAVAPAAAIYDPVAPGQAPDLTAFQERGGRLIAYHGQADVGVPPGGMLDYYAQVWSRMGGLTQTRDWFRLFMVPGMFHCRGGGVPDQFDMLSAIVDWVEHGKAPDGLLAVQLDAQGETVRTRPLYAYPNIAHYTGNGDVNDAANWTLKEVEPGEDRIDWIWAPGK